MADPNPPVPDPDADPAELARTASLDELQRMKAAEELHRLRAEGPPADPASSSPVRPWWATWRLPD